MDRKSILILVSCFVLMLCVWILPTTEFWKHLFPPVPLPPQATNIVSNAANPTPTGTNPAFQSSANVPPMDAAALSRSESKFIVRTEIPESLLVITNENARYTFTSRGGGLKEVELFRYPETVSPIRRKNLIPHDLASLNASTAPPVFSILGDESLQGDGIFKLSPIPGGVRAEKSLTNGLAIVKDFQLGTNYQVAVSVRFENQAKQSLNIPPQLWAVGTATPMGPQDNGFAEMVFWYNGSKAASVTLPYFNTNTSKFFGLFPRTPETEYLAGTNNVAWTSVQNQFFALITMPRNPAAALTVHMVNLPPPTDEEIAENPGTIRGPQGLQAVLMYPGTTLQAGQVVTNQFTLFAGPKEYQTLAHLAAQFNNEADLIMSFGFFGAVSKALLVTMNVLHSSLSLSYGWIIILITVVIKFLFWPLTAASTRSAKRMQALQPQLKALQEKYKDEPQKFTAKQWEFYKKNKVNPMSGCLPMLLQVPVFIGFYGMLRSAIELRGAHFLWMGDLSKPDTIFHLTLPFISGGFLAVNPMPLIMGVTLLWQASLAPVSPGMDPAQQKMMKYMPLLMLVFMYTQPSGLALYWTVSNLLTIFQTKVTKMQTPATPGEPPAKAAVLAAPQKKKK